MKLLDYSTDHLLFLLDKTAEMFKISCEVGRKTESATFEGCHLMNHDATLDMFYQLMIGKTYREVSSYYSCRGSTRCVAWYDRGEGKDGAIKGPEGHVTYIPDCISGVILNTQLPSDEKHELLKTMMLDLLKLEAAFEYRKNLFQKDLR